MADIYTDFLSIRDEKTNIIEELDLMNDLLSDTVYSLNKLVEAIDYANLHPSEMTPDVRRSTLDPLVLALSTKSRDAYNVTKSVRDNMFRICAWVTNHIEPISTLDKVSKTTMVQIKDTDHVLVDDQGKAYTSKPLGASVYSISNVVDAMLYTVNTCKQLNLTVFNRSGKMNELLLSLDGIINWITGLHLDLDRLLSLQSISPWVETDDEEIYRANKVMIDVLQNTTKIHDEASVNALRRFIDIITDNIYIYNEAIKQSNEAILSF